MHGKEALHFAEDLIEGPGFITGLRLDGVSVHRITGPHHFSAFFFRRPNKRRQFFLDLVMTHSADQNQTPGIVFRVQDIDNPQQLVRGLRRTGFQSDRIGDAPHEFDMTTIQLARPVADPQHMGRCVVPAARNGIHTGHGFFIPQK